MRILPMGFVFDQDGSLLLLHRSDRNTWEPIKGGMEGDESVYETMLRELYEETGIQKGNIFDINKIHENDTNRILEDGTQIIFRRVIFHIILLGNKPSISINHIQEGGSDHDSYGRFMQNDLEKLNIEYKDFFLEMVAKINDYSAKSTLTQ